MSAEAPSTLVVAVLGMGVVFVFLVFLSAMMAALTANAGRREAEDAPAASAPEPAGAGSPGWIAAATVAYLAAERGAEQAAATLPSAAAWRPYDTVEAARWRLRMPASATVARQATS